MDFYNKGLGFPLRLGPAGGLGVAELKESVRAMLEQILFTSPGERVNRPTFGVGAQNYVFELNSPVLADRLRVALDENVYDHLGKNVRVLDVTVDRNEESFVVRVAFEIVGAALDGQAVEVVVPAGGPS